MTDEPKSMPDEAFIEVKHCKLQCERCHYMMAVALPCVSKVVTCPAEDAGVVPDREVMRILSTFNICVNGVAVRFGAEHAEAFLEGFKALGWSIVKKEEEYKVCEVCLGDCSAANPPVWHCPMREEIEKPTTGEEPSGTATSGDLFQALGMSKPDADKAERGLNAVIRRTDMHVAHPPRDKDEGVTASELVNLIHDSVRKHSFDDKAILWPKHVCADLVRVLSEANIIKLKG